MNHVSKWISAFVMAMVCVLTIAFLGRFTRPADQDVIYLEWQSACLVAPDGSEIPYDFSDPTVPLEPQPEGAYYRFTISLPETSSHTFLIECSTLELSVLLDGMELAHAGSAAQENIAGLPQLQIPLPDGGAGRILELHCRPLAGSTNISQPLPRLTNPIMESVSSYAYANLAGMPAGVLSLAFAAICFLFIQSLQTGHADGRPLLLALAAVMLAVHRLSAFFGSLFLPESIVAIAGSSWIEFIPPLCMLAYLLLHRNRAFWRSLGWVTLWSAAVLLVWYLISYARNGKLALYINGELYSLFTTGYYNGLLYWLTLWLVGVCTLLSALSLMRAIVQTQAQSQELSLKNSLVMESYRAIEDKLRNIAALRHELSHQITALDAMYQTGDMAGLGRCLDDLKKRSANLTQIRFTDHFACNAILMDAASRASEAGIRFEAQAPLPKKLSIPTEDLCTLLMNMMDNALEACAQVPAHKARFIAFHAECRNGFLVIRCKNTYSGVLREDRHGRLLSTKQDTRVHGFGLSQMTAVAHKYRSILDISYTADTFTVQTALKLSESTE